MKKLIALLLAAALLGLAGCSAMLERSHREETPHEQAPGLSGDSDALEARTYQQLVSAVLYLVSEGMEEGRIRLTDYFESDIDSALDAACLEVAREDPLGAYVVDYMEYDYTRVVASYEANVRVVYRRTREELRQMVNVTGSGAIRGELKRALKNFDSRVLLRTGYFDADEDYIAALARQAYLDSPEAALGMPTLDIALYPDSGYERIVEVDLTYPGSAEERERRKAALEDEAQKLGDRFRSLPEARRAARLLEELPARLRRGEGSTAYDALLGDGGGSEAAALAAALVFRAAEMECTVETGTLNGETRYWNVIQYPDGRYHVDLLGESVRPRTAEEQAAAGYLWGEALTAPEAVGQAVETP